MSFSRVSKEQGSHTTFAQARLEQYATPRATYEWLPAGKERPIVLYHPKSKASEEAFLKSGFVRIQTTNTSGYIHQTDLNRFKKYHQEAVPSSQQTTYEWVSVGKDKIVVYHPKTEKSEEAFRKSGFVPVQGWAGVSGEKSVSGFLHKSDLAKFEQHYETGPSTSTVAWQSQQGLKRIALGKANLPKDGQVIRSQGIETRKSAKQALKQARFGGLGQLGREASVPPIFREKKTYMDNIQPARSTVVKNSTTVNPVYMEFLHSPKKELSGASWVQKYPTSLDFEGLRGNFKQGMQKFHDSLVKAGAKVKIEATHRPRERAYLMFWAYRIAKDDFDPQKVPPMTGVNIQWWHGDHQSSKAAAKAMVKAYAIIARPSLHSNHFHGNAVDMTIHWEGNLNLQNGKGQMVQIKGPSTSESARRELRKVAATFGVHQNELLAKRDPVHWSSTGA